MADKLEQLEKLVESQAEQIRTLKQAMMRMQQKLQAVSVVANRAQGQARTLKEQVQTIKQRG